MYKIPDNFMEIKTKSLRNINVVFDRLKDLFFKYGNGNYDLKGWNLIPIYFKGTETDIYFKKKYDDIEIRLGNNPKENSCLEITIRQKNGQLEGSLDSVKTPTEYGLCNKLPLVKKGSWMVELANAIMCFLGIPKIELTDEAIFKCQSGEEITAAMLGIHKGEKTFYEKFGYNYSYLEQKIVDKYNNLSINSIFDNIKEISNIKNEVTEYEYNLIQTCKKILDKLPIYDTTVREYMTYLLDTDCATYSKLQDLMTYLSFNKGSRKIRNITNKYERYKLYHHIRENTENMNNTLKCVD